MAVLSALVIWIAIVGLCTIIHAKVAGEYWWDDPYNAVPICFIGLPTALMASGLIVYAYLRT